MDAFDVRCEVPFTQVKGDGTTEKKLMVAVAFIEKKDEIETATWTEDVPTETK